MMMTLKTKVAPRLDTQNEQAFRHSLRLVAALLQYPDQNLRQAAGELIDFAEQQGQFSNTRRDELALLLTELKDADEYALQTRYVDTFDRQRTCALHLFEHVHGDSRERGGAMVDLLQTYERAGLQMAEGELPDHLPVVLQFASTQPPKVARAFIGEFAHILQALQTALGKRGSPYASVIAAVLELAGEKAAAVVVADDERLPLSTDVCTDGAANGTTDGTTEKQRAQQALDPLQVNQDMDEVWAEPPAFDGCSTRGQARPDTPQPITIVRQRAPGASINHPVPASPAQGARP